MPKVKLLTTFAGLRIDWVKAKTDEGRREGNGTNISSTATLENTLKKTVHQGILRTLHTQLQLQC